MYLCTQIKVEEETDVEETVEIIIFWNEKIFWLVIIKLFFFELFQNCKNKQKQFKTVKTKWFSRF